jgi:hypothetical protein
MFNRICGFLLKRIYADSWQLAWSETIMELNDTKLYQGRPSVGVAGTIKAKKAEQVNQPK